MSLSAESTSDHAQSITGTDAFNDGRGIFEPVSASSRRSSPGLYRRYGKRLFDIFGSLLLLLAVAPLMAMITALVYFEGRAPFYAHPRITRYGRTFGCLKFRSMRIGAAEMLPAILAASPEAAAEWDACHKLTDDPRVTRLGAWLRKSSLDELPQLFCVLRGDMSLVGPRPITEGELFRYGPAAARYTSVRPGLTGPWQIQGRNETPYENRVALDVAYVRRLSFFTDLRILALTAGSVLRLTGK